MRSATLGVNEEPGLSGELALPVAMRSATLGVTEEPGLLPYPDSSDKAEPPASPAGQCQWKPGNAGGSNKSQSFTKHPQLSSEKITLHTKKTRAEME